MKYMVKLCKRAMAIVLCVCIYVCMYVPLSVHAAGGTVVLDISEDGGVWTSPSGQNIIISDSGYKIDDGVSNAWIPFDELIITGTSTTFSNSIQISGIPAGAKLTLKDLNITEADAIPTLQINAGITVYLEGDISLHNTNAVTNNVFTVDTRNANSAVKFSGADANLNVVSDSDVAFSGSFNIESINNLTIESKSTTTPAIYCSKQGIKNTINASGDVVIKSKYMGISNNTGQIIDIKANDFILDVQAMSEDKAAPAISSDVAITTTGDVSIDVPHHMFLTSGVLDIVSSGNVTLKAGANASQNLIQLMGGQLNISANGDVVIDVGDGMMGVPNADSINIKSADNVSITSKIDDYMILSNIQINADGDVNIVNGYMNDATATSNAGVVMGNVNITTKGNINIKQSVMASNNSAIGGEFVANAADVTIISGYKAIEGELKYTCSNSDVCEISIGENIDTLSFKELVSKNSSYSLFDGSKIIKISSHICEKGELKSDDLKHWYVCKNQECTEVLEEETHKDADNDKKCDLCSRDMPHLHSYTQEYDATNHWNECLCGDKIDVKMHSDSDKNGKCDVCGVTVLINNTTESQTNDETTDSVSNGDTTQIDDNFDSPDTGDETKIFICLVFLVVSFKMILFLKKNLI